jgi:hypothetical protein
VAAGFQGICKTHQTELFQGADCADVITGAARLGGARMAYTSVMGLRRYARPISPVLLLDEKGIFALDADIIYDIQYICDKRQTFESERKS